MIQNRNWMWTLGFALLLAAAGSWVIVFAIREHDTSPLRFGILTLAVAFLHVVLGILLRRYYALGRHLLLAVLYALIGSFFLIFSNTLPIIYVLLIGYAFVAIGLLRVGSAVIRRGLPGRFWLLPAGLVSAAIGVMVLLAWPASGLWMVRLLIGVELLVGGAATFALALNLRRQTGAKAAEKYEGRQPRFLVRAAGLVVVLALFLAGVWFSVLPLTQRYTNRMFEELPGIHGKIGAIELNVKKRVITLREFRVQMTGKGEANSFMAEQLIMRPDLKSILNKQLIGSVAVINPTIKFTRPKPSEGAEPDEREREAKIADILLRVRRLAPFRIDRLDVKRARVDVKNVMPELDMNIRRFNLTGRNLANKESLRGKPYSTYRFEGRAMGAKFEGTLRSNLLKKTPTLRIKAKLSDLPVVKVNDYLKSKFKMSAEGGTLTAFTEISVTGRKIDGYARTFLKDLEVSPWPPPEEKKSFLGKLGQQLKDAIQDLGVKALSRNEGVLATETPIRGELGAVELDLISAAGGALRNAFGKSLDAGFKDVPGKRAS